MARTYDIAAFTGQTLRGEARTTPTILGDSGHVITGALKLAQWVAAELLTERGSRPYEPLRGTRLMAALRQGRIRSDAELSMAAASAISEATATALALEVAGMPADEKIAAVTVLSATIAAGLAVLRLQVRSAAGDTRDVLLPLSTLPR